MKAVLGAWAVVRFDFVGEGEEGFDAADDFVFFADIVYSSGCSLASNCLQPMCSKVSKPARGLFEFVQMPQS